MIISKVYSVDMPTLFVQIQGTPEPAKVRCATAEQDDDNFQLLAKDEQGKIIGRFQMGQVAGWWVAEDATVTRHQRESS